MKHEKALDKLVVKSHEAALLRREDLRRAASVRALAEEPELHEFADAVESIALDPEREDFFRCWWVEAGAEAVDLRNVDMRTSSTLGCWTRPNDVYKL